MTHLDVLEPLGPFFAVHTHSPRADAQAPWQPLPDLIHSVEHLAARVSYVRHRLAERNGVPDEQVEQRVAASVTHLGITARLVSPVFAVAVLTNTVLHLDLGTTWWQPVAGGAVPLSLPLSMPTTVAETADDLADALSTTLINAPIAELTKAFAPFSVSPKVLTGNVASAIQGAVRAIGSHTPQWTDRARAISGVAAPFSIAVRAQGRQCR